MCIHHTVYVEICVLKNDFDPPILTIPEFFKSNKNWLNYGLLKRFSLGQKFMKLRLLKVVRTEI